MNRFRVLMMLTAFLATAAAAHAQAPRYFPPSDPYPLPRELQVQESVSQQPQSGCPAASWYSQALQGSAATWQRIRAVCSTGNSGSCCEGAATAKAPGCVLGIAGSVKGCEVAQAPKACCCAKACACCESCKAKTSTGHSALQPCPMASVPNCLPPQCGSGIVQIVPVQSERVHFVRVAHTVKPVRLVTPDLEAVCDRMQHRGDVVVLEGNVLLLCKKHAQPIRIEAQRVLVNMRDGSFTVESDDRPVSATPTNLGVMRTSAR